jgi:hypothetical protein
MDKPDPPPPPQAPPPKATAHARDKKVGPSSASEGEGWNFMR